MPELQFDLPLGDTEAKKESLSGFQVGYQETKLRHGADVNAIALAKLVKSYPDYTDNKESYDAMVEDMSFTEEAVRYHTAIKNRTFDLDENNNVIEGETFYPGAGLIYNDKSTKGYLLAVKNGYSEESFNAMYGVVAGEEAQRIAQAKEGTSLAGNIAGMLAGYATETETLIEFASPAKIMGSTVFKGAAKAFAVEASLATIAEVSRQKKIKEHMEKAGLQHTLWDSTKEVLINAGFAGVLRGIGSAVMDWNTFSKINNKITDKTDKEIFARFAQRENFKLTNNTNKHLALMGKVEADIEKGKEADISGITDIDIAIKTDETIEANNFKDNLSEDYQVRGYDVEEKTLVDIIEAPTITDDVYGGMVTNDDGDALIKEFADNPEISEALKEIEELINAQKGDN